MAAIAVGVAAAATVASTAMKASQGGGEMGQMGAYAPPGRRERILSKEVEGLNRLEADLMSNAVGQYGNLAPYLYTAALGMVPQYEDNTAALAPYIQQQNALQARQIEIQQQLTMTKKERKAAGLPKNKAKLQDELKRLNKNLSKTEIYIRNIEAQPKRITGFTPAGPDDLPADSPLSSKNPYNQINALTNEGLIRALRGEEPLDQTMISSWNEQEDKLRSKLRSQLGPDYEFSTPGMRALANFERERSEAFQQYNTQTVLNYSSLSQSQAQLREQQLSGILERGVFLPNEAATIAGALQAPTQSMMKTLGYYQEGRRLTSPFQEPAQPNVPAEVLGSVGSGLGSMGMGAMGGGAGAAAPAAAASTSAPEVTGAAPAAASQPWGVRRLAGEAWGGIKSAGQGVSDFLLKY